MANGVHEERVEEPTAYRRGAEALPLRLELEESEDRGDVVRLRIGATGDVNYLRQEGEQRMRCFGLEWISPAHDQRLVRPARRRHRRYLRAIAPLAEWHERCFGGACEPVSPPVRYEEHVAGLEPNGGAFVLEDDPTRSAEDRMEAGPPLRVVVNTPRAAGPKLHGGRFAEAGRREYVSEDIHLQRISFFGAIVSSTVGAPRA